MRSSGFSLAELLLAAFLVMVSVLAVVCLSLSVVSSQRQANEHRASHLLAREVLERQVQYAQANPESTWWSYSSRNNPYTQDDSALGNDTFRYVVYVSDIPLAADPESSTLVGSVPLKRVEVVVYRHGAEAKPKAYGRPEARLARVVYAP